MKVYNEIFMILDIFILNCVFYNGFNIVENNSLYNELILLWLLVNF